MGNKNSAGGVEWVVHPDALLNELNKENIIRDALKLILGNFQGNDPNLVNEVKSAVDAWYDIYHAVVLLTATIYPLHENVEINREEPHHEPCGANPNELCLPVCHVVTAYTLDEGYTQSPFTKYGIILERRIKEDFARRLLGIEGDGSTFVEQNSSVQPQFKFFFDHLKPFLLKLPDDFFTSPNADRIQEDYLDKFRDAVSNARVAGEIRADYDAYVAGLHQILAALWGTNIKAKLAEMNDLRQAPNDVGSEPWWTDHLKLDPLEDNIADLFAGNNGLSIQESNKVAAIAYLNDLIYTLIRIRFEEPDDAETSHGLIGILDRYREFNRQAGATDEELEIWRDILAITSGAIAWQVYQQASLTVQAMESLT